MNISFSTIKRKMVEESVPFTIEQLSYLINSEKPSEIYNSQWSQNKPFIVITGYNDKGFMMYCNGWADKTPKHYDSKMLYKFLKYQGFEECYIKV